MEPAINLMRTILEECFHWDFTNPSVIATPERFVKYLKEFHQEVNIAEVLGTPFKSEDNGMIIQRDIPFRMVCEHHLLPATGVASVGYVPDGVVVGLSKLSRLVDAVGVEKPSLQEHINTRIADLLMTHIKPKGCMIVTQAVHSCMSCRGSKVPGVPTIVSTIRGVFFTEQTARMEYLSLLRGL